MMASSLCVKRVVDGGAKNRNLMQLLHACFATQTLHENGEFRETWRSMNNMNYGEKFQELACALWEHVALACSKFLY